MARVATRSHLLGTVPHRLRIERVRPAFTPLASLSQLDLRKLSRTAKIDLELGYLSAGRCRQMVRATVKKGIVTRIDIDSCTDKTAQRAPRELRQLIRKAQRVVARRIGPLTQRPISIDRFLPQAARMLIETITCYKICFYGPWACIYCCTRPSGGLVCGGDVVVTPPIIIDA
jgi:hypothetical protein